MSPSPGGSGVVVFDPWELTPEGAAMGRIILPAFSPNAAGRDGVAASLPQDWRAAPLRCLASTGDELLDFGPLPELRRRLRYVVP